METLENKILHSSLTDVGLRRPKNEDNLGSLAVPDGYLFVVCDGMGGHVGGQKASEIAVDTIIKYFAAQKHANPVIALNAAIVEANSQIYQTAQANPQLRGMGTTVVALLYQPDDSVYIAHVGDSRIYLHTNGKLHRITKDHSFVQQLVDNGTISDDQAEHHPQKNQLLKALGTHATVEVEVAAAPVLPKSGDMFMLCSDGLCGLVNDMTMQGMVASSADIHAKAKQLVEAAKNAGGHDNITVQLVQVLKSKHTKSIFVSKSPAGVTITDNPGKSASLTTTMPGGDIAAYNATKKTEAQLNAEKQQQENEQKAKEQQKKKVMMALAASLALLLVAAIFVAITFFGKSTYVIKFIDESGGVVKTDTIEGMAEAKEKAKALEAEIPANSAVQIIELDGDKEGEMIYEGITRGGGNKKYAVHVYDDDDNVRRVAGYFDQVAEAEACQNNMLTDYSDKGGYKVCIMELEGAEYTKTMKSKEIEEKGVVNPKPTPVKDKENISHTVKSGDWWSALYEKYGVCPCFIKLVTPGIVVDGQGNPQTGQTYNIPKKYSSKKEYNPTSYQTYEKTKVGYNLTTGQCDSLDNTGQFKKAAVPVKTDTTTTTTGGSTTNKTVPISTTKVTKTEKQILQEKITKAKGELAKLETDLKNSKKRTERKELEDKIVEKKAEIAGYEADLKKLP